MNLNRCISLKVGNEPDILKIYTKRKNIMGGGGDNESNIYDDAALYRTFYYTATITEFKLIDPPQGLLSF